MARADAHGRRNATRDKDFVENAGEIGFSVPLDGEHSFLTAWKISTAIAGTALVCFALWHLFSLTWEGNMDSINQAVLPQQLVITTPPSKHPQVTLEVSEYGRPIIWVADYSYKTAPWTALRGGCITNRAVFSSRHQAIRWAKFELRDVINWSTWKSSDADYPYMKNCDNPRFDPTFVATFEHDVEYGMPGMPDYQRGRIVKSVTIHRTEVSQEFDWWAKEADGDWNR